MSMNIPTMKDASKEMASPTRLTVDAFTRTLHALMGLSFTGAYITAESETFRLPHVTLGYTLGGLLLVRLVWGLLGPRHASWSAMWGKLRGLGAWLDGLRAGDIAWRQAQNLFMALAVVTILLTITPVVLSGLAVYQEWAGEWMEEVHEFLGDFMLAAVLAHIAGVVILSMLRQRNLAMPMLSGRVPGPGPNLVKSNHRVFATLLLAAVLSFWFWQWQESPQAQAGSASAWWPTFMDLSQTDDRDD